jgi:hypothetical protein
MTGADPSNRRLLPGANISLRPDGMSRDIGRWYKASFLGTISCIILYTVYGFIFVHSHALKIAHEMELLQRFNLTPLIRPDDEHLVSFIHLLGSALLFGLTLGILNALICMALTLPKWSSGRLKKRDMFPLLLASITAIYFGLSEEMPFISILFGIICPLVFVIPWLWMLRKSKKSRIGIKRWAALTGILISPFLIIFLMHPSYTVIRDTMLEMPLVSSLSDIYYSHTLLAADVIKPPAARTQNVIAVSKSIENIGSIPHGTLWLRTDDPCSIQGADMIVSKEPLKCRSIFLKDSLPANDKGRIFREYGKVFDLNRHMRNGIGIYYYSGPFAIAVILLFSWLGTGLVRLSHSSWTAAAILIGIYLALFIPFWHTAYLAMNLGIHPEKLREYVDSGKEKEIYLAVATYPGALRADDIDAMIRKGSTRTRINALVEAGERRDPALIPLMEQALADPQMNIRTKACWALGRIASPDTAPLLEKVIKSDPSWYVRDYAYAALGNMRPEAKVVTLDR